MKAGSNHSDGAAGTGSAVIVFDGVCALCNRWVRFLLRFDRKGRYRFAAMQGQQGSAMLRAHGLDPEDPGVLVLSLLAGAADELKQALLVNPHDLDGVADAIATAATMSLRKRKERWHAMMEHLRTYDINHWRRSYLDALEG